MPKYIYRLVDGGYWTVGHYDKDGFWCPVADYVREDFADRAAQDLNKITEINKDPRLEKFTLAAMQGFIAHGGNGCNADYLARIVIRYAVETLAELDKYQADPENYFIK